MLNFLGQVRLRGCIYLFVCMVGAGAGLLPTPVRAGPFTVAPVRVYMTPKDRAVALTLTNQGDEELVMQADLYLWQQKPGGESVLTLTEDLFLAPPILKLAPKSRQVVRLALLRAPAPDRQLTYRVILRELVEARPPPKEGAQLQIALALSLPIFITPPGAVHRLGCQVTRAATDALRVACYNAGNAYVHPREFHLTNLRGDPLATGALEGYILPGIERRYELRHNGPIPGGKARLLLTMDDGSSQGFDVEIGN